ncbi:hypothetical protein ABZU76_51560 [Amycolatopsis sp. NPDC005232]|uniref:hypothetical protein n=1 Tax=Amycolatopsis sp. NPDC005232 TaxID=3157027 RepID=UPI0033AF62D1
MSVAEPTRFLTVDFSTPVDIGFLPQHAETPAVPPLTIGWAPRLGTTYLPFDSVVCLGSAEACEIA